MDTMYIVRHFICCMFLQSVTAPPQINLDLTDWVSDSDAILQHNCLHVVASIKNATDPHQIISYCMSEWPSKWTIQKNNQHQNFTFADLYRKNITSEQLYRWSSPMDVVERYQFYLNQLSISNESLSMATQLFYNCTPPRFGPLCQYSMDAYEPHHSSLNEIIRDHYLQSYEPTTLTCYIHLQCNRGSTLACLDWTDICDEIIDCPNGVDEEYCWQLQINKCQDNEFRCRNGQCISKIFSDDNLILFECLDRSDEFFRWAGTTVNYKDEPTFKNEDVTCRWRHISFDDIYTSSCVPQRNMIIQRTMFSDEFNTSFNDCLLAFKCYYHIPNSLNPKCVGLCQNGICQEIINKTCPEMFYAPATPIAFGHVYFAYTKEYAINWYHWPIPPQYICYNDQLCGGFLPNVTLLSFNNTTCRRPEDFPLRFDVIGRGDWTKTYVRPIYNKLFKCNTIARNDSTVCDQSFMYRCINSSKCISNAQIGDNKKDCDYNDDEEQAVINKVCLIDKFETFFKCTKPNKCIHIKNVRDGVCDCEADEDGLCDDEESDIRYIRKHISFATMCDGFTELKPLLIEGRNETDETGCEHWQCNNTYTRCDGFWNCFNGADEVDCNPSPLLNCSLYNHICISPDTNQLMCLSLDKVNDGNIDCLGATDETNICRSNDYRPSVNNFYCQNHSSQLCILSRNICFESDQCEYNEEKQICYQNGNLTVYMSPYISVCDLMQHDVEKFLCNHRYDIDKPRLVHFSLKHITNSTKHTIKEDSNTMIPHSSLIQVTSQHRQRCHRGLGLHVWLDSERNLTATTCLCPPSFYGDICQYQNERVSLTMQFGAFSDSRQTLFSLIVSLIDDSDKRIIHSYQQFTYLYIKHCQTKFNIYLLYLTRPKDQTRHYAIHIDIYEKISLAYRGSLLVPLRFPFLPVNRVAVELYIPQSNDNVKNCLDQSCVHGQCIRYSNDGKRSTFCQCHQGWSGRYCTIPYSCNCSSDSLCIGILANNRSLCVCPINKWGSQCLLHHTICQFNHNTNCLNGGRCLPIEDQMISAKHFICICSKGYSGDRCQIDDNKIIVSFHQDIVLPQSMFVHFIKVNDNAPPENGSTFKTIPINQNSVTVYWSNPFHIVFAQFDKNFYLMIVQKTYNQSATIRRTIEPSDRCKPVNELFNKTIVNFDLIRRIKYYHLPCQITSPRLSCFFDDSYFCLCNDFGHQRVANCFEFNSTIKHNCFGQSKCENGAECVQDRLFCSQISMCVCPPCFYGVLCQFSSSGFGLSLDAILGYHIKPHINIRYQPFIVQISMALTIIMTIAGLINGILSLITFKNKESRKTGCGLYLFSSSITTLLTMIIFAIKFWILNVAQMTYITNRSFLKFQCLSIDFLLRIGLSMDQWLNACVAMERAVTTIKGVRFNKKKSKKTAKYIIVTLMVLTISTTIHDPIYRHLIDDDSEKRIWCIVTYSSPFQVFNSAMNIFHFLTPFIINFISSLVIIKMTTQRRNRIRNNSNSIPVSPVQFEEHKHLLIAPLVLVILGVPRLIISLTSGCLKSVDDSSLFIAGYFISFIPPMLTFVLFVLPSKVYTTQFQKSVQRYRRILRTSLQRVF